MSFSFFLTGFKSDHTSRVNLDYIFDSLKRIYAECPSMERMDVGMPANFETYHGDTPQPSIAVRLDFQHLSELESLLSGSGIVKLFAESNSCASLGLSHIEHQVMVRRPVFSLSSVVTAVSCDYLVHYPGVAHDMNAWLGHYLSNHAKIMSTYPDVQEVDVYSRVDWVDQLPWMRVGHMQRNRISFPDSRRMLSALGSSTRAAMTADHNQFPTFTGRSKHYPVEVTIFKKRA